MYAINEIYTTFVNAIIIKLWHNVYILFYYYYITLAQKQYYGT